MQLKTIKLTNNQHNLVHYYQYYDFETIGDIKNDIEKKYNDIFIDGRTVYQIRFEKYKDMNAKLRDLPIHSAIQYTIVDDPKEDDKTTKDIKKEKSQNKKKISY